MKRPQIRIVWDGSEEAKNLIDDFADEFIHSGSLRVNDTTVDIHYYYRDIHAELGQGIVLQGNEHPYVVDKPRFTNHVARRELDKAIRANAPKWEARVAKRNAIFSAWGIRPL